mgnify:CR=1 FL=1
MLIGEFHHNLDEKGRIIIPSKFRDDLGSKVVVTRGLDGCLFVYSMNEWNNIVSKLKSLSFTKKDARMFNRFFMSSATVCDFDRQGRINIPASLVLYADIKKECTIIGVNDRLEVWATDKFDSLIEDNLDILVNVAGLKNGQEAKFWDFTSSEFDDCMAVNAKVPFFLSRLVAKDMIANNVRGNIINIGGIKSFIGEPSPYSMSKFAQNSLTKGLARMLAPYGICMNGIAPGATNTSNFVNLYLTDTSNCRYSTPDEIANIALLLASDLCRSMVGSIVICDGGEMLQYFYGIGRKLKRS